MDFGQRARLAERLRSGRPGEFAKLIGRFRRMAAKQRARKTERAPGELVGIETGDDLARLIPSELASLGVPAMHGVFAARYAEGRLFVYEQRGEVESGLGAIIAGRRSRRAPAAQSSPPGGCPPRGCGSSSTRGPGGARCKWTSNPARLCPSTGSSGLQAA